MNIFKRGGFGGNRGGGRSDDRSSAPKVMHKASCSACRKACEVPFKPNGKKPVLCGDCFQKDGGHASFERSERPDRSRSFGDRGGDRGGRGGDRSYGDKVSYPATCSDCGARCDVPFKPTQGKPVKCRMCFKGGSESFEPRFERKAPVESGGDFRALNLKLDRIISLLEKKERSSVKEAEVEEGEDEPRPKKAWAKIKYD